MMTERFGNNLVIRTLNWVLILFIILPSWAGEGNSVSWDTAQEILRRIHPPTFPDREFLITDFGAVGDGKTDCTEAFRQAIKACHKAGGGRVIVPAGIFLTGAIHLKSNVNLHLTKDAIVRFNTDPKKYLPVVFTRWEGVECMNYSPLIYAFEQENIAITGEGLLDGQASSKNWWAWKGSKTTNNRNQNLARKKLLRMAEEGVPVEKRVFGEGGYLRPNFIQPYRCKNVLIEGVRIVNSPMWEIHPVLCENVIVRGVNIRSHGPNNDGCDPESCTDVLIEDCIFDTGDDCIALKSGRNADGRRINKPIENVVIRNCQMKDGHGGVVIGSEISGGARNIFVENCIMDSPNLNRALRIKTNSVRGGLIENIFMRDVKIGEVSEAIVKINFYYGEGDAGNFLPVVRNIYLTNVTSQKSPHVFYIKGYESSPIKNIFLENCAFYGVREASEINAVENIVLKNVIISGKKP